MNDAPFIRIYNQVAEELETSCILNREYCVSSHPDNFRELHEEQNLHKWFEVTIGTYNFFANHRVKLSLNKKYKVGIEPYNNILHIMYAIIEVDSYERAFICFVTDDFDEEYIKLSNAVRQRLQNENPNILTIEEKREHIWGATLRQDRGYILNENVEDNHGKAERYISVHIDNITHKIMINDLTEKQVDKILDDDGCLKDLDLQ